MKNERACPQRAACFLHVAGLVLFDFLTQQGSIPARYFYDKSKHILQIKILKFIITLLTNLKFQEL